MTTTSVVMLPEEPHYKTREDWLTDAVAALAVLYEEVDYTLPPVRVSVGWPGGGSMSMVIGQCWAKRAASDDVAQVFISPILDYSVRVLDVLAHELIHAIDENESGHQGRFVKIARAIGLDGPPTATTAGPALSYRLGQIAAKLGPYPHARLKTIDELILVGGVPRLSPKGPRLKADGPVKQGTRMLKLVCVENSGYKVRTTRHWLDLIGPPLCPCHREPMLEVS